MGGTSKSTQNTSQSMQSTQNPWDQAMPALTGILGGLNSQVGNYAPTGAESGALDTLQKNAANTPNYGPQATGLATDLMGGGTGNNTGIMNDAYSSLMRRIDPIADSNPDPSQNPYTAAMLDTITNRVSNTVNGQFAGAGRDLSGMNTKALASGLAEGMAPTLFNQYNTNVATKMGAANDAFAAGGNTANGLQSLIQTAFGNRAQGLDYGINGVPTAQNAGANNVLQASATARGLPLQNLGMLAGLTLPIAGLGGTTTGKSTGQTQGSYTMSPIQQAQGYANIFGKLFPMGL